MPQYRQFKSNMPYKIDPEEAPITIRYNFSGRFNTSLLHPNDPDNDPPTVEDIRYAPTPEDSPITAIPKAAWRHAERGSALFFHLLDACWEDAESRGLRE